MATNSALATTESKNPLVIVTNKVQTLVQSNRLPLPVDYSPEVALQSAWSIIQQTPNLASCSKESIQQGMFDMVVQGLNPTKKQCYLIPRGGKLCIDRSYFGDAMLAEFVKPGLKVSSEVIYEGEEVTLESITNEFGMITIVTGHKKAFPRKSNVIIGAYAGGVMVYPNGKISPMGVEIMDIERMKSSWRKGQNYKDDNTPCFHNQQRDQACKRTVTRLWCKPIINSSTDAVLLESVRRQDENSIEAEFDEVVEAHQGAETLAMSAPKPEPTFNESQPEKASEKVTQAEVAEKLPKANKTPMDELREAKTEPSRVVDQESGEVHEQSSLMDDEPKADGGRPGY